MEVDKIQTELLLKAISDSTADAVFAKDLEGRLIFANPATLALIGKPLDEVIGRNDLDLLEDKEAAKRVMATDRRIMDTGLEEEIEEEIPLPDGELRVWYSRKMPYRDAEGKIIGLLGISRDITERRKSDEQLRLTLESIGDGFFACDKDWCFTYINAPAERILGIKREHVLGKNHWDVFPLTIGTNLEHEYRRAAAGEIRNFENYYEPWSRWFHLRCFPRQDGGIAVYFQDITAQKIYQKKLQAQDAELHLITHHAPIALVHCDSSARYLFANQAYTIRFGLSPLDVIGKTIPQVIGEEAYSYFKDYVQQAVGGKRLEFEMEIPLPTGRRIMHSIYVPDPGPPPVGFVAVIQDVTERREAERILREADKRKDEFLAILAHELRNPLAPLQNALKILESDQSRERVNQLQPLMSRQLEHLTRLVDDLLDVARITTGKIVLKKDAADLTEAVHRAVELSKPLFDLKNQELQLDISEDKLIVKGDAVRLTQVIGNLLNNASKYTGENGIITLKLGRENGEAVIIVQDNGMGLAEDMVPRVFDLFAQADGTLAHSSGGLGLGLTLVRRLIEKHGGQVNAHSAGLGRGSTFTIRLPLHTAKKTIAENDKAPQKSAPQFRNLRVLVVDDNRDSADSIGMLMKMLGHSVAFAYDGNAAVEQFELIAPDVILLDIGLPEKDGFEVARDIRSKSNGAAVVIIAMTGYGRTEDREMCMRSGFNEHLIKPVDFSKLEHIINNLPLNQAA